MLNLLLKYWAAITYGISPYGVQSFQCPRALLLRTKDLLAKILLRSVRKFVTYSDLFKQKQWIPDNQNMRYNLYKDYPSNALLMG